MKPTQIYTRHQIPQFLTTEEFAAAQRCSPRTVRKNLCIKGHHHGIKPTKLPNGRLLWNAFDLVGLLEGGHK